MEQGIKLENTANDYLDYVEEYIEEEPLDIKVEKEDYNDTSAEKDLLEPNETNLEKFCWNLDYLKVNPVKVEPTDVSQISQTSNEVNSFDSNSKLDKCFDFDTSGSDWYEENFETSVNDCYEEILPSGKKRKCRSSRKKKCKKTKKLPKLFSCSICGYTAKFFSILKRHEAIHSNNRKYQCSECDFSTKYSFILNKHKKAYHKSKSCVIQQKIKKCFTSEKKGSDSMVLGNIECHENQHDFKGIIHKCLRCSDSFSDLMLLKAHEKASKCRSNEEYEIIFSLPENQKELHNKDKEDISVGDAKISQAIENCKSDNKSKSNKNEMGSLREKKTHFIAQENGSPSVALPNVEHLEYGHDSKKVIDRCIPCGDSFSDLKNLRAHKESSKCIKRGDYKTKSSLSENLKEPHDGYKETSVSGIKTCYPVEEYMLDNKSKPLISVGEKQFQCTMCDFSTNQHVALVDHEFFHTGKRPYKCLKCNFDFKYRSNLYSHRKWCNTNNKEKPFQCKMCNYSTNLRYDFEDHKFLHSGKRLYTCFKCNFSFKYRTNLCTHAKRCTGTKSSVKLRSKNKTTNRSSLDETEAPKFLANSSFNANHDHNLRKSNHQKTFKDISDSDENVEEKLISCNKACKEILTEKQISNHCSSTNEQKDKIATHEECNSLVSKELPEKSRGLNATKDHSVMNFSKDIQSTKTANADNCQEKIIFNESGNYKRELREGFENAVLVDKILNESSYNPVEDTKVKSKKRKPQREINFKHNNNIRQNGNEEVIESIFDFDANSASHDLNYNRTEEEKFEKNEIKETAQKLHTDEDETESEKESNKTLINLSSFSKEPELGNSHKTNDLNNLSLLKCIACEYTTQKPIQMNLHQDLHISSIPYKCLKCNYGTKYRMMFFRHKRSLKCKNNRLEKESQILESVSSDDNFSDEIGNKIKTRISNKISSGYGRILRERRNIQKRNEMAIDSYKELNQDKELCLGEITLDKNVGETDDKTSDNSVSPNIKSKILSSNVDADLDDYKSSSSKDECNKELGLKRKRSKRIRKCKKLCREKDSDSENSDYLRDDELCSSSKRRFSKRIGKKKDNDPEKSDYLSDDNFRLRSKRCFSKRINKEKYEHFDEGKRTNILDSHKSDDNSISGNISHVSVGTLYQNYNNAERNEENTDREILNGSNSLDVNFNLNQLDEMNLDEQLFKFFPADSEDMYEDNALIQIFFQKPKVLLEELKLHFCAKCNFVSQSSSKLETHTYETHFRSKKYECSECSYTCVTWQSLKTHTETHTKDVCGEITSEHEPVYSERIEGNNENDTSGEREDELQENSSLFETSFFNNCDSPDIDEKEKEKKEEEEEDCITQSTLENMQIHTNKIKNISCQNLSSIELGCQVVENNEGSKNIGNVDLSHFYEYLLKKILKIVIERSEKQLEENINEHFVSHLKTNQTFMENMLEMFEKNSFLKPLSDQKVVEPGDKTSYEYFKEAVEIYKESLSDSDENEVYSNDTNTLTRVNADKDCLNSLKRNENVSNDVLSKVLKYIDCMVSNVEEKSIEKDKDVYSQIKFNELSFNNNFENCIGSYSNSTVNGGESNIEVYPKYKASSKSEIDTHSSLENIENIQSLFDTVSSFKDRNNLRKKLHRKSFFCYNSSLQKRKNKYNVMEKKQNEHIFSNISDKKSKFYNEIKTTDKIKSISNSHQHSMHFSANECSKNLSDDNFCEKFINSTVNSVNPSFKSASNISKEYVLNSLNSKFRTPSVIESVPEVDKLSHLHSPFHQNYVYTKNEANVSTFNCESNLISNNCSDSQELPKAPSYNSLLSNVNEFITFNSDSNGGIILVPRTFNINVAVSQAPIIYSNSELTVSRIPAMSGITKDVNKLFRTVPEPSISITSEYTPSYIKKTSGLQDKIKMEDDDTPVGHVLINLQDSVQPIVSKQKNSKLEYCHKNVINY